jgi:hypothetical protein
MREANHIQKAYEAHEAAMFRLGETLDVLSKDLADLKLYVSQTVVIPSIHQMFHPDSDDETTTQHIATSGSMPNF